jgi:hypothetical protein
MSYEYRGILWHVAYSEITKSPVRLLFGYGGLTTETMDLSRYFKRGAGGTTALLGFTSWDNQMACDLIEFGYVGFIAEMVLLGSVLVGIIKLGMRVPKSDRNFMLAMFAACGIYTYAMTNVYIFSPQLKCLFWAVVACGIRYGQFAVRDALAQPAEPVEDAGRTSAGAGPIWST